MMILSWSTGHLIIGIGSSNAQLTKLTRSPKHQLNLKPSVSWYVPTRTSACPLGPVCPLQVPGDQKNTNKGGVKRISKCRHLLWGGGGG